MIRSFAALCRRPRGVSVIERLQGFVADAALVVIGVDDGDGDVGFVGGTLLTLDVQRRFDPSLQAGLRGVMADSVETVTIRRMAR